jgi:hypothetical protein
MSASPASSNSPRSNSPDVFDQLAQCQSLLTARQLAQMLAISPKKSYNYVSRDMIPHFTI